MSRRQKVLPPRPVAADCKWPPARIAALRRKVWKKMRKFRESREAQYLLKRREAARKENPRPDGWGNRT